MTHGLDFSKTSVRLRQLFRYVATAGAAAAVDLGGFVLLERRGLGVALASVGSFAVATVVNYLLSARFVFFTRASLRGYGRFILAAMLGFVCNIAVTVLGVSVLGLPPILAKIVAIGVAFFFNFLLNAVFVFRPAGSGDQ